MIKEQNVIFSATEIETIRSQFPVLSRTVNGKPLVYFDNGATTQKPLAVINCITDYYSRYNANIHRGVHTLSQEASIAYENARTTVANHLKAKTEEIIFTRGTTESVNMVASSFVMPMLNEGDEVLVSGMEHHSNIVPWQLICEAKKAKLVFVPITHTGELAEGEFEKRLSPKTKIAAFTHVSNSLGTVNPVAEMTRIAQAKNIPVFIDGAQSVPHMAVDVKAIGADFYAFSGHKIYGPTGIGILYAREDRMAQMKPYQGGGGIIKSVRFEKTEYVDGPLRFEAGTPHIEGAIALAAALDYVNSIGMDRIAKHEHLLLNYATEKLLAISGVNIIGQAREKAGVISISVNGMHTFDIGTILDQQGVAVRTGYHCTQPVMDFFCVDGTTRISFGLYNTIEEIDIAILALQKAIKMLS